VTIAFYLPGYIPVYAFSLLLGAGAALGLGWLAWRSEPRAARPRVVLGLAVLAGGLIGGRLAFVAVYAAYYRAHPNEILALPLGGLSWPGAALGGLLVWMAMAWLQKNALLQTADVLVPLFASISLAAWLGCWLDGCAYGQPSEAWYALPAVDEWGNLAPRWPLQPLGALLSLLILIAHDWARTRAGQPYPGRVASFGFLALALAWWLLTTLRADPAPRWNGQRLDAWAALGFLLLAAILAIASLKSQVENCESGIENRESRIRN